MDTRAAAIHVVVCLVVGGLIAALTPAKWLAASLWTSASLFINGSLADVEDARPGGFNNPDDSTPPYASGAKAFLFAARSLAVAAGLVALGFLVQFG
ncbi:MAG: hypothetical protein JSS57_18995 [Proteobacteria bacterium]|nr:hypothetical protein [Pseudomonadota bacterium]